MQELGRFIPPVVPTLPASTGSGMVVRLSTDNDLYEDAPEGWRLIGGVNTLAADAFTADSLPSAFPRGNSIFALTVLGNAPTTGSLLTVRGEGDAVYQLLFNQSSSTAAPRINYRVKVAGSDS